MAIILGVIFPTFMVMVSRQIQIKPDVRKKSSKRGRINITQFTITVIIILGMALPDSIGDAISKEYAYNYKDSSLIIIKYFILIFAYGMTHPYIHETITQKVKILGKYWPVLLVFVRMGIVYYFPELSALGFA